jgi:hypothetical protein
MIVSAWHTDRGKWNAEKTGSCSVLRAAGYSACQRASAFQPAALRLERDPFLLGGVMREIGLSRGMVALVDDSDYDWLNQWKWHAHKNGPWGWYAVHNYWEGNKCLSLRMHRLVAGTPDGYYTDHVNGNGLDNRRANLRICTHAQNQQNRRRDRDQRSSNYKGVYKINDHRWRVRVTDSNGVRVHIGYFCTEQVAATARDTAALALIGAFALTNAMLRERG